jgi:hypothetical protein
MPSAQLMPQDAAAPDTLSTFHFNNLEFLAENSITTQVPPLSVPAPLCSLILPLSQGVMLRLGSVGADLVDHPELPIIFSLNPVVDLSTTNPHLFSRDQSYNFHIYFLRNSQAAAPASLVRGGHDHSDVRLRV